MTLLNAVLPNILIHYLSFYRVPKIIVNEVIKIQRAFLWGGSEMKRNANWINWDMI